MITYSLHTYLIQIPIQIGIATTEINLSKVNVWSYHIAGEIFLLCLTDHNSLHAETRSSIPEVVHRSDY